MALLNLIISLTVLVLTVEAAVNPRYYPRYHLAPECGWMNDPNGLSFFQGFYHLFYQYNPKSSLEPGIAHWGHARSRDLVNWEPLSIAMYPDETYDADGVFSGSAYIEDGLMYLYFTGNVNLDAVVYRNETQALAVSGDGFRFVKYPDNPLILGTEFQPNIRDPKVWKHEDTYYMVLGHSIEDKTGEIVLFTSKDKFQWNYEGVLAQSDGSLGYMFECPDLFELDGEAILLFSPQGVEPDGYKYRNLYQTGYLVGKFDYKTNKFIQETEFVELDHGHDFYATQTFEHEGRRILFAWMDMWDQNYPEGGDGFTGMMTLPRILTLTPEGHVLQNPAEEVDNLSGDIVFSGNANPKTPIVLPDKSARIWIESSGTEDLELLLSATGTNTSTVSIKFDFGAGFVILDRGGNDGVRMAPWTPSNGEKLLWRVYVDASSIELFCGKGEATFSSRFFPTSDVAVSVVTGDVSKLEVKAIPRTLPITSGDKCQ
ncbi:unnamed protein product [Plutella xylostella]|uniref:Sucrose-6-phosphate hydrolase n=1 Tax=Plutella xylostella TaxID=51655 RepID=A0A8S4F5D6_PLUXY|nr:unnamed protein product [Plutella xylostella]